MTGPTRDDRPDDDADGFTDEELARTDQLLDQLSNGTIDLSDGHRTAGELAALTLLRRAGDPTDSSDSGTAPAFIAAVGHRAPEVRSSEHPERVRRRWGRLAGTTIAAKIGIVAALAALGVAAAGATGGLSRHVPPERDAPPTTSAPEPAGTSPTTSGGSPSARIGAVAPHIQLLDESTLELLRSVCLTPGGTGSAVVREFAQRNGMSGTDACAEVELEASNRADGESQASTTTDPTRPTDPDAAAADTPEPGSNRRGGDGAPHTGTNPNTGGGTGSPGGSSNAHGNNPNSNAVPNPNAGANPNSGGGANHGRGPSAGGNPNPGGGNPNPDNSNSNAGGGNTGGGGGNTGGGGGNPNAGGGNPNAGGGNPNAGGGNPNAGGGNPNPGNSNSNAGGGNSHRGPNAAAEPHGRADD